MVAYATKVLIPLKGALKRVPAGFPVYGVSLYDGIIHLLTVQLELTFSTISQYTRTSAPGRLPTMWKV